MSGLSKLSFCAAALVLVSACGDPPPPPPTQLPLTVAVDPSEVLADGQNTVTVSVTYEGTEPVRLSTTRGTWQGATGTVLTLEGATRQATLITCDSRTSATCAGEVRVNAGTESGSAGVAKVKFVALETCNNGKDDDGNGKVDCQDSVCFEQACQLPGGTQGTCTGQGACVCATGAVEVCSDGVDNNCDGKADCQDTTCGSKTCTLPSGLSGLCNAGSCACPNKPEVCNNGVDDDCDGLVDCADSACQPVGNEQGKVCDVAGNTCAPVRNGASTCSVCSGNGGVPQTSESLCGDGKDNDCDGKVDCQDSDCGDQSCTTTGKVCNGETLLCVCAGPALEGVCDDGSDNDCDGKVDCQDIDCQPNGSTAKTCKANGFTCNSTGACACSGNGGAAEAKETSCGDGFDNDCDGLADCQDLDCRPAGTTAGKACTLAGKQCNLAGQCVCPTGASTETTCNDGKDDDCDGLNDCFDDNCQAAASGQLGSICGTSGQRCNGTACQCPYGESSETTCFDGVDNDCDGKPDCQDPDCGNRQCNAGSSNYVCSGATAPFTCKDVSTSISVTVTASPTRVPANGTSTATISAVLKDGTTALAARTVTFSVSSGVGRVTPTSGVTDATGKVTTTFTSDAQGGPAVVTASYNTGTTTVVGNANVDMPKMGQIKVVSQEFPVLGVRYSSFQESSRIIFQVLDTNSQPYPAGLMVSFTHAPVGGSFIGAAPDCTSTLCSAQGVTDAEGKVSVVLHSGTVASTVTVSAGSEAGGLSGSASASNIAIVGAKPSGSYISVSCTPQNVPALTAQDCTSSQMAATITCTASFADRFNNVLGVPTTATFSSEAGAAGAPVSTKDGFATGKVEVKGFKLPVDVSPNQNEQSIVLTDKCGTRTHNPRDGLVTIIVSAQGEEGFVDGSNGFAKNGVYDVGENFIDLAEPFVDFNDNGSRDDVSGVLTEPYIDTNQNGRWDGPNGAWDSTTTVWAETRIVYSGFAEYVEASGSSGTYPALARWFVPVAPLPPLSQAPAPTFNVNSAKADGGATATTLGVYFADLNFNVPTSATTYAVASTSNATVVKYTTAPTQVDHLGMSFSQQFCAANGTLCSSECLSAPCYVKTGITSFSYGAYGMVEIKGGSTPGSDTVRASSKLLNIDTRIDVSGTVN